MHRTIASTVIAAFLATVPAAFPAQAATTGSLSRNDAQALCAKLEKQYDFIRVFKPKAEVAHTAALYTEGEKDCTAGKPAIGVKDLRQAILDLNVEPHEL